ARRRRLAWRGVLAAVGQRTESRNCIQARIAAGAYSAKKREEIMRIRLFAAVLAAGFAAAALPVLAHDDDSFEIATVSNRADLISGGDALVEVTVPKGVAPNRVQVRLNGADITGVFTAQGRTLRGLVEGLVEGRNDVT